MPFDNVQERHGSRCQPRPLAIAEALLTAQAQTSNEVRRMSVSVCPGVVQQPQERVRLPPTERLVAVRPQG